MAVVKANFVQRGRTAKARAKATIRYMLHRPGKGQTRTTRALFGVDGVVTKRQADRLIDEATRGMRFFRIVVSPDPRREDRERDLDLWTLTAQTMQKLEERLKKELQWIAVEHNDHTPNRHIHALVLVRGKLTREDFAALRKAATESAVFQRQERDLASGYGQDHARAVAVRESAHLFPGRARGHLSPRPPQPKPSVAVFTCFSCGAVQWISQDQMHRCGTCGARLSRNGRSNSQKGHQWAA